MSLPTLRTVLREPDGAGRPSRPVERGLIVWIPGGFVFLAAGVVVLLRHLERKGAPAGDRARRPVAG